MARKKKSAFGWIRDTKTGIWFPAFPKKRRKK
jgi:hypothetical protein